MRRIGRRILAAHPESSRQQRAVLPGARLLQELDRTDGHAGSDCISGSGIGGEKTAQHLTEMIGTLIGYRGSAAVTLLF